MRTTLTIDDELAVTLKRRAFESGKSFKAVVNETLERGLQMQSQKVRAKPYKIRPISMGKALVDLTHATRLAAELEDEEIVRKMDLRK